MLAPFLQRRAILRRSQNAPIVVRLDVDPKVVCSEMGSSLPKRLSTTV
jgi:hypothetical protein